MGSSLSSSSLSSVNPNTIFKNIDPVNVAQLTNYLSLLIKNTASPTNFDFNVFKSITENLTIVVNNFIDIINANAPQDIQLYTDYIWIFKCIFISPVDKDTFILQSEYKLFNGEFANNDTEFTFTLPFFYKLKPLSSKQSSPSIKILLYLRQYDEYFKDNIVEKNYKFNPLQLQLPDKIIH